MTRKNKWEPPHLQNKERKQETFLKQHIIKLLNMIYLAGEQLMAGCV